MATEEISAQWLSKNADSIFSHTASYHSHVPMAGRQREMGELGRVLQKEGRRLVFVSSSLGSGKTFLLDRMSQRAATAPEFVQSRESFVFTQANLPGGPQQPVDGVHEPVWIIEELDRKPTFDQLRLAVHRGAEWLSQQESATLVLTGDRFLEHDAVVEVTGRVECERSWIGLDDLDVPLLGEALERRIDVQRLAGTAVTVDASATSEVGRAAAQRLLEDGLVASGLIPGTLPEVANFRDALTFLEHLASQSHDLEPCRLGADDLARFGATGIAPRGLKAEAQVAVANEIVRRLQADEPWEPVELEQLLDLVPHRAGDPEDYEPEEYLFEVVHPLVRAGLLEPLGIPHQDGVQYVGPFLPTPRLFMLTFASMAARMKG